MSKLRELSLREYQELTDEYDEYDESVLDIGFCTDYTEYTLMLDGSESLVGRHQIKGSMNCTIGQKVKLLQTSYGGIVIQVILYINPEKYGLYKLGTSRYIIHTADSIKEYENRSELLRELAFSERDSNLSPLEYAVKQYLRSLVGYSLDRSTYFELQEAKKNPKKRSLATLDLKRLYNINKKPEIINIVAYKTGLLLKDPIVFNREDRVLYIMDKLLYQVEDTIYDNKVIKDFLEFRPEISDIMKLAVGQLKYGGKRRHLHLYGPRDSCKTLISKAIGGIVLNDEKEFQLIAKGIHVSTKLMSNFVGIAINDEANKSNILGKNFKVGNSNFKRHTKIAVGPESKRYYEEAYLWIHTSVSPDTFDFGDGEHTPRVAQLQLKVHKEENLLTSGELTYDYYLENIAKYIRVEMKKLYDSDEFTAKDFKTLSNKYELNSEETMYSEIVSSIRENPSSYLDIISVKGKDYIVNKKEQKLRLERKLKDVSVNVDNVWTEIQDIFIGGSRATSIRVKGKVVSGHRVKSV